MKGKQRGAKGDKEGRKDKWGEIEKTEWEKREIRQRKGREGKIKGSGHDWNETGHGELRPRENGSKRTIEALTIQSQFLYS